MFFKVQGNKAVFLANSWKVLGKGRLATLPGVASVSSVPYKDFFSLLQKKDALNVTSKFEAGVEKTN